MADASPALEAVRFETADQVATITLNRPQALNAFDRAMKTELIAGLRSVERDRSVRVVVLTGEGRAFCAGQDLREPFGGEHPTLADELRLRYNPVILAIARLAKPVIAAVNGVAAGAGCSLALACDLRLAAEGATFVLDFGRVGLVPDSGATWFLPRIVGQARAAELALLGDPVSADEAARIGLVNRVVPAESLLDEARALAARLAEGSPLAMGLTKRALRYAAHASLEAALEHEAALQGIAGRSKDHEEGVAAFRAKRAARFTGD
jgi:2-(1,2-epoxy-1,2-dihydrophenyl)acetyl-CoA isomerase